MILSAGKVLVGHVSKLGGVENDKVFVYALVMSQNVLPDAKISSFSSPTTEDIALWGTLSSDEKQALLRAELDKGRASGVSSRSMGDLWQEALKRAGQVSDRPL